MKLEEEIHQSSFRNEYQKVTINILYTSNWIENFQNQLLKPYGLSQQQYNILRILRGQYPKPATVNVLIDRMLDKMSNASRLVEKLKQKGLVERKSCEEDRRRVDVKITGSGMELLKALDKEIEASEGRVGNITEEEAQTLNRLLDKIRG